MNIYFAGSIRGGRDNKGDYQKIISYLKKYGKVLSEHVGKKNIEKVEDEQGISNQQIYEQDVSLLRQSDVVIAEVSTPSLGVGYEIAKAESLGKKILCIYKKEGKRVSAMIKGNKNLVVKEYKELEDVFTYVDEFLKPSL